MSEILRRAALVAALDRRVIEAERNLCEAHAVRRLAGHFGIEPGTYAIVRHPVNGTMLDVETPLPRLDLHDIGGFPSKCFAIYNDGEVELVFWLNPTSLKKGVDLSIKNDVSGEEEVFGDPLPSEPKPCDLIGVSQVLDMHGFGPVRDVAQAVRV